MTSLDFIVLYSENLEETRLFYETILGSPFVQERHGQGPAHYAGNINGIVLEIYPGKNSNTTLGFIVDEFAVGDLNPKYVRTVDSTTAVLLDPDGRSVHLNKKGHSVTSPIPG